MTGKKLIVIGGPTAVGKTAVAMCVATEFNTSVVSADSRQIFREMQIGTAKPTAEERAEVPHYFVDSHSIIDDYDAAAYGEEALLVIRELFEDHDEVVLCGGSGLYIRAVCEGFDEIPDVPADVRENLMRHYEVQGLAWLQNQVRHTDPEAWEVLDQRNTHRLIRALEVKMHTGTSILSFQKNKKRNHDFEIVKIGLELPREDLYRRIDDRMDRMIADGLFEEAQILFPRRGHNALQTVGYKEIFDYFDHAYDRDECIRLLKRNSRRYAKRQLTWFKRDQEFRWFNPADINSIISHIKNR